MIEKERQLSNLTHQVERLSDQCDRVKSEKTQIESAFERERSSLIEKYENTKQRLGDL